MFKSNIKKVNSKRSAWHQNAVMHLFLVQVWISDRLSFTPTWIINMQTALQTWKCSLMHNHCLRDTRAWYILKDSDVWHPALSTRRTHTHFKPGIQYPHCATSVCLLPWKGQQGHWIFWVRFLYVSLLDGPISMMLYIQCWELQWGKWWIDRNRRFCSPLWQYSGWIRYPGGIWRRPGGSPGQPCRVVWSHSVAGTREHLEMSTLIHDSNTRYDHSSYSCLICRIVLQWWWFWTSLESYLKSN